MKSHNGSTAFQDSINKYKLKSNWRDMSKSIHISTCDLMWWTIQKSRFELFLSIFSIIYKQTYSYWFMKYKRYLLFVILMASMINMLIFFLLLLFLFYSKNCYLFTIDLYIQCISQSIANDLLLNFNTIYAITLIICTQHTVIKKIYNKIYYLFM